ncbi:hypothetical protein L484_021316 [Morus notabilis]|uniref:Uncharacterized protein n=1 Tax=Morus notabilis TaxID=981085 RepID=W9SIL3_9ROSA|nr:hypothetical protein L484_021316 [Morus notabilis]
MRLFPQLLIVGRRDYGSPTEFAIARIIEATIGLICFVLVELLLNPARAATLAKTELSQCIGVLRDCVENVSLFPTQKNVPASRVLREKHLQLKCHVDDLEKFIEEAEMEPNFWFLPFDSVCYHKLLGSFSTLMNLLLFVAYEIEFVFVFEASQEQGGDLEEVLKQVNEDLEFFKMRVESMLLRCIEKATSITTLQVSPTEDFSHGIELGRLAHENVSKHLGSNDKEVDAILSCFLRHLVEVVEKEYTCEGTEKFKRQLALSLTGLGFGTHSLAREANEIDKKVKELAKLENPSNNKNLHKISCKK